MASGWRHGGKYAFKKGVYVYMYLFDMQTGFDFVTKWHCWIKEMGNSRKKTGMRAFVSMVRGVMAHI